MGSIMKKLTLYLIFVCMMFSLLGCRQGTDDEYYETTLSFDRDGRITDVIFESFSESYYSEEGLSAYFNEMISDFTSQNIGNAEISLEELNVGDGKARARLTFDSADTYSAFNGVTTFFGTVNEAYDKGYINEIVLKSVDSPDILDKVKLMEMKDSRLIIVGEVVQVKSPTKILYTSANVEFVDDKSVRVSSDSTGLAYILIK